MSAAFSASILSSVVLAAAKPVFARFASKPLALRPIPVKLSLCFWSPLKTSWTALKFTESPDILISLPAITLEPLILISLPAFRLTLPSVEIMSLAVCRELDVDFLSVTFFWPICTLNCASFVKKPNFFVW